MSGPAIRASDAASAASLAALHRACFDEAWDEAAMRELLAMPGAFAYEAGDPASLDGLVIARIAGGEAEILTIGVRPEVRGSGLGRRLLEAAAIHAAALGAEALFLEVAEDNRAALRLYETSGFYLVGMRPGYYRREGAPVAARTLKLDLVPPA
ncbi:MAG: GNAT family N-acetyltransferase [Alphaproteobacteria bacterium]|nr:GNAT family N-acetyltransferase [Alphaproteobacteria bacterium]MDX5415742.1 GNAT family N-acetyltransferase [Alphaproteobacteria bacterium]MDX5493009.1 GNAT family N-acetyltransferase [Alphaproteobacteria bacterium]